ncbi:unnamed protein product [Prunus armeniaca]
MGCKARIWPPHKLSIQAKLGLNPGTLDGVFHRPLVGLVYVHRTCHKRTNIEDSVVRARSLATWSIGDSSMWSSQTIPRLNDFPDISLAVARLEPSGRAKICATEPRTLVMKILATPSEHATRHAERPKQARKMYWLYESVLTVLSSATWPSHNPLQYG